MDFELFAKIVGTVVAVIGAGKLLYDLIYAGKSKLREEYKFAKEFLTDIKSNPAMHPYAQTKGYQAIAGTNVATAEEVKYLLSLEDTDSVKNYFPSRKYIKFDATADSPQIEFVDKYKKPCSRNWRKKTYLLGYAASGIFALAPMFLSDKYPLQTIIIAYAFTLSFGGYWGWKAIWALAKIRRGELLVENQKTHTPNVIVDQ